MMDLTNGIKEYGRITEGFTRDGTHTKEYNMWLVERSAPTPQEKEVIESIPYMQGDYDFSLILGNRVYENRPLSYKFEVIDKTYRNRKTLQTLLENWLMKSGHAPLYDDHAMGYYYVAKCTSVIVDDSAGGLSVQIEFNGYPFKIAKEEEGNDIWDIFNFELDVSQITKFTVNGTKSLTLYNPGSNMIAPEIRVSSEMEIMTDTQTFIVPSGTSESSEFILNLGENELTIKGNGTIEFVFYKELL